MAAVDSVVEEGPKAAQRVDSSRGYTPLLSSSLPSSFVGRKVAEAARVRGKRFEMGRFSSACIHK